MKPQPEIIELDEQELQAKLDQIEAALGAEMAQPFRQLLAGYITVLGLLREKNISIQRLRNIIFGSSTERSSKIMPPEDKSSEQASDQADDASAAEQGNDASDEGQIPSSNDGEPASSGSTNGKRKKRRPGHGRNPAKAYTGCKQVVVTHSWLHPGDSCPRCTQGSVYRQREWSAVVRLKGQAPVGGTVYQLERLRCHLCGCLYTAELPEQAGPVKYDPSVASIIATLRYGEGLPWNRLQRIQKSAGVPLPASTQWERVRDAVQGGIRAAYEHLLELAAQGELFHSDDTSMRVQALTEKLNRQEPLREDAPERRGVFTTGILSRAEGRPWIALFFTGPHHAGENLRNLLAKRREELPPPIQMCDPLSRNMPEDLNVILANCLTHGRRKFVEVIEAFPSEVKYLIQCLKRVYQTDAEAREQQLLPDERLRLHQQQSGPVMDQLHQWLRQQLDQRKVEPNSSLGGAIRYMLKHWEKMTLFLRVAGAPLDNNICEQALKMAIRHRKNSLFYKTMRGAEVGDLYMSLIHTCYFCGADPCGYLTQLQRNGDRVRAAPGDWMPWNYRQQLDAERTHSDSSRGPPGATEAFSTQPPSR
ncbi:MAG: IS66 family transposase [Planctomycetota bacterium]|jgi:hypothetical protein